jgi:hypothetical protein
MFVGEAKRVAKMEPFNPDNPFVNFPDDFQKIITPPFQAQYALIPERVEEWIFAHQEGRYRDLARKVAGCFRRITYDEFKEQLKNVCQQFQEVRRDFPFVIVLDEQTQFKSEPWVVLHALKWLEPDAIIPIDLMDLYYQKEHGEVEFVFLDDGAFTGISALSHLNKRFLTPSENIFACLPFCTERAKNALDPAVSSVLCGERILCFDEQFSHEELSAIIESCSLGAKTSYLNMRSLAFFQHHLVDDVSGFPKLYTEGRGINGVSIGKPLIQWHHLKPPYKGREEDDRY